MNQKKHKLRILNSILVCVILLLFCLGGYSLWQYKSELRDDAAIDELQAQKPAMPSFSLNLYPVTAEDPFLDGFSLDNTSSDGLPLMDFTDLRLENSGVLAWLTIDDTQIDYAVVQAEDNSYYLSRDAQGNSNKNGALFIDYRVHGDFSDFNNVIYGHHMKSGRMFQNLVLFKDRAFFGSHRSGTLYTPNRTYRLTIFAVALTTPASGYYEYGFVSSADREEHLSMIRETAMYYLDGVVTANDRILCLSTCSYEYTDARTVVLAKLET